MDAAALHKLHRHELQKLAIANKIKANIKSETIINRLVNLFPLGVPVASENPSRHSAPRRGRKRSSFESNQSLSPSAKARLQPALRRSRRTRISTNRRQPANIENDSDAPQELIIEPVRSPSCTTQGTYATPESSPEGTPEPCEPNDLEFAVKIMDTISTADQESLAKIVELRAVAEEARKKVADLRAVLRAERGLRERMEAYVRYWTEISPEWSHRELWADVMRVRPGGAPGTWDELSTDDELEPEVNTLPEDALTTLKPGQALPPEYWEAQKALVAAAMAQMSAPVPVRNNLPVNSLISPPMSSPSGIEDRPTVGSCKRGREDSGEDDEDTDRYRARARSNPPANIAISAVTSIGQKRLDKGKGRMKPEDIEKMNREAEQERRQTLMDQGTSGQAHALGLTEEEIEQDNVVALLSEVDRRVDILANGNHLLPLREHNSPGAGKRRSKGVSRPPPASRPATRRASRYR